MALRGDLATLSGAVLLQGVSLLAVYLLPTGVLARGFLKVAVQGVCLAGGLYPLGLRWGPHVFKGGRENILTIVLEGGGH